jgi:hypothetical protein
MLTLNLKARISKKNHVLQLDLKDVVPDGEYQVLVVIEEIKKSLKLPIRFHKTDVAIKSDQHFGRDEIYGDNGR